MIERTLETADYTLVAYCDDGLAWHADRLLELLSSETSEEGGLQLRDGARIEVGWTVLTLIKSGDRFVVHEPDFSGDPHLQTRDDVSCSLEVLALQNHWAQTLGAPLSPSRYDTLIVNARGAIGSNDLQLQRSAPSGRDSGWFIGTLGERPAADLESREVWTLVNDAPMLPQFLGLPPGYLVILEGGRLRAILDDQNRTVHSD